MKYLIYVVGEIILVVIGILIAVYLNTDRKNRVVEINILEGIRSDIMRDTLDFNMNIRNYKKSISRDSLILNHLINKKAKNSLIIQKLYDNLSTDIMLVVHQSHFEEAKRKGLSIISNEKIRDGIGKLYEFHYQVLISSDNQSNLLNHAKILNQSINPYFSLNETRITISDEKYEMLLNDSHFFYIIKKPGYEKSSFRYAQINVSKHS